MQVSSKPIPDAVRQLFGPVNESLPESSSDSPDGERKQAFVDDQGKSIDSRNWINDDVDLVFRAISTRSRVFAKGTGHRRSGEISVSAAHNTQTAGVYILDRSRISGWQEVVWWSNTR